MIFFFWYPTQNASQKIEKSIIYLVISLITYMSQITLLLISEVTYFNLQHKDLL